MIRRTSNKGLRKGRRHLSANLPALPTDTVPTLAASSTPHQTVTFDQAVAVAAGDGSAGPLPAWTVVASGPVTRTVTAVVVNSPTSITLTFSGAIAAMDPLTIPNQDPSIRTTRGGYVQPGVYTLS